MAARISDSVDMPVLVPYSQGSTRLLLISSSVAISATVHSTMFQPGSTPNANVSGKMAPIIGPTYGTKRSTAASKPHTSAPGTPMNSRPSAIGMP